MEGDLNTEDSLEVSFVQKTRLAQTDAVFFAKVIGATSAKGKRRLIVEHENSSTEHISLDRYFLLSIVWRPGKLAPLDSVKVETSAEEQNEGYEVCCHILEQAGILEICDKEESEVGAIRKGPKRVEVVLVNKSSPKIKITMVVLECWAPSGPFKHFTIKGREWISSSKLLKTPLQTYHSSDWWISQVDKYSVPGKTSSSFHGEPDLTSWKRVRDFLGKMEPSEVNVVRHFEGCSDDRTGKADYSVNCGGFGRRRGIPDYYRNPYQEAAPVFFRVAGDEIGKKTFLIQAEKQVKKQNSNSSSEFPTLKAFLENAEKKVEAGDVSETREISSAVLVSSRKSPKGGVGDSRDGPICGSRDSLPDYAPELDCMDGGEGFDFGAVQSTGQMDNRPLSAIERALKRWPRVLSSDLLVITPSPGKRKKNTLH